MLEKIEHTFLKANATEADLKKLCDEAMEYGFGLVAINPAWVKFCKEYLKGSNVLVDAAVGFPLGQTISQTKATEALHCIQDGADEIDMVMNVGKLIDGDYAYVKRDIKGVVDICHQHHVPCKVILETCLLSNEQIIQASKLCEEVKADYIKTSTGFAAGGATVEHIRLMRNSVSDSVKIKASAGIRDLQTALSLIEAGADRLGTSSGVTIAKELKEHHE